MTAPTKAQVLEALRRQGPARLPKLQQEKVEVIVWADFESDDDKTLLQQILSAVSLSMEKARIFSPKERAPFLMVSDLGLWFCDQKPISSKGTKTFIEAPSLATLRQNKEEKRRLWHQLKTLVLEA